MKTALAAVLVTAVAAAVVAADINDWPSHDHDAGGRRFSPLKQITPANVATLQPAWTFDTGATGIQVTPLVVDGIMYVTAGKDIVALDPETAKVIWRYTAPGVVSKRGVAYWPVAPAIACSPSTPSAARQRPASETKGRSISRRASAATSTAASAWRRHPRSTRTS
jgi:glucose dehydrogenase